MPGSLSRVFLHLVWSTLGRMPLITPDIEARLHHGIQAEVRRTGSGVLAAGGTTDHVHLLVEIPPMLPFARLVQQVKGATSHLANHELESPSLFRWQSGYGAFSVSRWDLARLITYIEGQKDHHRSGHLLPDLESSDDSEPS